MIEKSLTYVILGLETSLINCCLIALFDTPDDNKVAPIIPVNKLLYIEHSIANVYVLQINFVYTFVEGFSCTPRML